MKARLAGLAVSIAVLAGSVLMPNLMAQDKKAPKAAKAKTEKAAKVSQQNVQGTLQDISKDKSMLTIRDGTATRVVAYNASTKFLYGHSDNNKPGALSQVKQGNYISCAGTFDSKAQLMARDCVYREEK